MMDSENQDLIRELDPFGFLVNHASAIKPLGGTERGPDPRYVFHTPYVAFKPGRVLFSIRFDRLQASFGELRVHIHAFVPGSGRDAIFVTSSRLQMADRPAADRGMSIVVYAVPGATYAAYGICLEGTDARAAGITITAEEIEGDGSIGDDFFFPTPFGEEKLQTPSRLVGDGDVSLAEPVSQPMTEAQLAEPAYQQWSTMLGRTQGDHHRRTWQLAFIAQSLDRYGMLRPGARGIALGEKGAALGPVIKDKQCDGWVALLPKNPNDLSFSWASIPCSQIDAIPGPDGLLPAAPLSFADRPAHERGFDFLWSIGLVGEQHMAGNASSALIEPMMLLRPGGYAIHMFHLATSASAPANAIPRTDVERHAITLISRNFSVAQLNFATDETLEQPTTPFGLVVRKG
jgi:hypothetical protein